MFKPKNFKKSLFTYCLDNESDNLFDIYFGDDPDKRKIILRQNVNYDYYDKDDFLSKLKIPIYTIDFPKPNLIEHAKGKNIVSKDGVGVEVNINTGKGKGKGKGKEKNNDLNETDLIPIIINSPPYPNMVQKNEKETFVLSVSRHLQIETKLYQLDNIQRKIIHNIDGLNPSRRKCLAGARLKFRNKNDPIKIFQLGGYITEQMHYHHGDASLNKTLIGMAQSFVGANTYPLIKEKGQFGTRNMGGDDHGSPRYINANLNKTLVFALFPAEDDYILKYKFEDGHRAEPEYFVPL
jgi:hypothetical protein